MKIGVNTIPPKRHCTNLMIKTKNNMFKNKDFFEKHKTLFQ